MVSGELAGRRERQHAYADHESAFDGATTHDAVLTLHGVEEITDTSASTTKVFRDSSAFGNRLTLSDAGPAEDGAGRITSTNQLIDYSFVAPDVRLLVDAGRGDDTIEMTGVDQVLSSRVVLQGGGGSDTLTGPPTDAVWTITGKDRGNVDGVAFVNFETLQGADDNEDLFVIGARGSLTGGLDGGAGGFDSMEFRGGRFGTVEYVAFGPHSGTVTRDGVTLSYDGLEPIDDVSEVDHRIINLSGGSDDAVLTQNSDGLMTIAPAGIPTFETVNFFAGKVSTTINLGGDSGTLLTDGDRLVVRDLVDMGSTNLSILGNDGIDTVEVEADAALLTTGSVTINAERISVLGSIGSDTSAPASITLAAEATDNGNILADTPLEGVLDDELRGLFVAVPRVSVDLTGGSLRAAGDITVSAAAGISIPAATPSSLGGALDATLLTLLPDATVTLDGASVRTAGSFSARSEVTVEAAFEDEADASDTDATADAAVTVVVVAGESSVTTAGATRIEAGGSVSLTAVSDIGITSTADGGSDSSSVGATLAVTTVQMDTSVDVGGATSIGGFGTDGADAITLAATLTGNVATTATSTAGGAQDGSANDTQSTERLADPNQDGNTGDQAATSEGGVGFAGAVVVSDYRPETVARISTSGILTTDGTVSVSAGSTDKVSTLADGSNTGTGATGVGVAVAVSIIAPDVVAEILDGGRIRAGDGTVVTAGMAAGETFETSAVSGSGNASQTGFAGSLAIQTVLSDVTAQVADDIGGGLGLDLGGGDLTLTATNESAIGTSALPGGGGASGGNAGFGASVALSVVIQNTFAGIADGAALVDAGALAMTASLAQDVTTRAEASATGAGTAATPVAAITVSLSETEAGVGTGGLLEAGSITATATRTGDTLTDAEGSAADGSTTVGVAFALTIAEDSATATLGRSATTTGDIALTAEGESATRAAAKAGAAGAQQAAGGATGNEVDAQNQQQQTYANNQSAARGGQGSSQTQAPSSDTGQGGMAVAAAVGLNIQTGTVGATIADAVTAVAGGDISLTARSNRDSHARGDGSASIGQGTAVGVGLGINVSRIDTIAAIGDASTIEARSLSLEAGEMTRETVLSVDTSKVVDVDGDSILVGDAFAVGDVVRYTAGSTAVGGLDEGTDYHVISVENGRVQLSTTAGGSAVDITATGAGTGHALTSVETGSEPVAFEADKDVFTLNTGDAPLRTGDELVYSSGGGTDIGGLTDGTTYFAIVEDGQVLLAETRDKAFAGEGIEITSAGAGTAHTLSEAINRSAADAVSGASGGSLGIAGSVAINVAETRALADLDGTSALAGDLSLTATSSSAANARAVASQEGSVARTAPAGGTGTGSGTGTGTGGSTGTTAKQNRTTGIGASFALTITDHKTSASILDGTGLAGQDTDLPGNVTLAATGSYDAWTEAKAGAGSNEGGTASGTAVSPVGAVAVIGNATRADIGTGTGLTFEGNLSQTATHDAETVTIANAATTGTSAAIGIAVGLTLADDSVSAVLRQDVTTDGDLTQVADGYAGTRTVVSASAAGAPATQSGTVSDTNQQQTNTANSQASTRRTSGQGSSTATAPQASTAEGALTVAAGLSLDIAKLDVVAGTSGVLSITARDISVSARGNMDGAAEATGEASNGDSGSVGAAVAIIVNTGTVSALMDEAAVTARSLSLHAGMATRDDDETSIFGAGATSGASGAGTGFAGSFALNLSRFTTFASLGAGSVVVLTGGVLSVTAGGAMDSTATATAAQQATTALNRPASGSGSSTTNSGSTTGRTGTNTAQTGSTVGVGASVSVNATAFAASAVVAGEVSGAADATIAAEGSHAAFAVAVGGADGTVDTSAQGGTASTSGSIAVTPVAAAVAALNSVRAELAAGARLSASGTVTVRAELETDHQASAEGSADGTKAAIGASIGLVVGDDISLARVAGNILASGAVQVVSTLVSASRGAATASAIGSKANQSRTAQQQTNTQVMGASSQAGTTKTAPANSTQTSSGTVTVAAAIGINIVSAESRAEIAGTAVTRVTVVSDGAVSVESSANVDSGAEGDGRATKTATGKRAARPTSTTGGTGSGDTGSSTTVGVGLAVNVAQMDNIGLIENAAVTGDGISALATTADRRFEVGGVTDSSAVDVDADTITVAEPTEAFTVGEQITYSAGGGTAIGGLTDDAQYFIVSVSGGTIQLSETSGGPAIDLTDRGAGDGHKIIRDTEDTQSNAVSDTNKEDIAFNPAKFEFVIESPQGLVTGDAVVYDNGGRHQYRYRRPDQRHDPISPSSRKAGSGWPTRSRTPSAAWR